MVDARIALAALKSMAHAHDGCKASVIGVTGRAQQSSNSPSGGGMRGSSKYSTRPDSTGVRQALQIPARQLKAGV
jgi:hypothetical protein